MPADQELLRATFDDVAELYDRARPAYPPAVFDDLAELARLPEGARVVEIGCGTGKATIPLARRGYRISCVELGVQLAAVARRNLAAFPEVEVVVDAFEQWQPPKAGFDAVVAFTSFHWVPDEAKYAKPASLLRRGGALAVAATQHVLAPGGDGFFLAVQEDYDAVIPDDPHTKAGPPGHPDDVGGLAPEMRRAGSSGRSASDGTSGTSSTTRIGTSTCSTRTRDTARSTPTRVPTCSAGSGAGSRRSRTAPCARRT